MKIIWELKRTYHDEVAYNVLRDANDELRNYIAANPAVAQYRTTIEVRGNFTKGPINLRVVIREPSLLKSVYLAIRNLFDTIVAGFATFVKVWFF